jgi:RNA-directed DNA polymerase
VSSYKKTVLTTLELPPAARDDVPFIIDDYALALYLGVRCKTLWYLIGQKAYMYKRFTIPKSDGRVRVIYSPKDRLKHVQRRIDQRILRKLPVLECVGAYVEGRSCRDSAARHTGHHVRIAMDLKDFFPSHTRAQIRHFFKETVGYSHFVAGLLADICTVQERRAPFRTMSEPDITADDAKFKHFVPQGSPASPMLCNLVAQERLDRPVLEALNGTGWVYTRYSDDLSISHPERKTRKEVDAIIELMRKLITNAGYRTNPKKLKIQRCWRRQRMLGMVVNSDHPNIPVDVYRRYRAIIHNCLLRGFEENAVRYGFDPVEGFASHLRGKVAYFMQTNPQRAVHLHDELMAALVRHEPEITTATVNCDSHDTASVGGDDVSSAF